MCGRSTEQEALVAELQAIQRAEEANGAANSDGGVAKPAARPSTLTLSPLAHLTKQSTRFGVWEVVVFRPESAVRSYVYDGKKRTSYSFECLLVSASDPTQYVLGNSHGRGMNQSQMDAMVKKYVAGHVFLMSRVSLAEKVKQQYNSAPKTEVVAMKDTTFSRVLVSAGKPKMPEPNIPVAACCSITREQQFDCLALIRSVGEPAPGGWASGRERIRCTIQLIDGSKLNGTDKPCVLPITVFADKKPSDDPALFKALQELCDERHAVAVFGIQGKKSEGSAWSFSSSFSFHVQRASETTKGKELEAKASDLMHEEGQAVPQAVLHSQQSDHESYKDMEGTETTCALLGTLLSKTKLQCIERSDTCWQINWCRVHVPDKAAQVITQDGARLWMSVRVDDETGHIPSIFMRQEAALELAQLPSKDRFLEAHRDDELSFPPKASLKIVRKSTAFQTP